MPNPNLFQLLANRTSAPNVQLPTSGPQTWLDTAMHRAGVMTGISDQKPGDAGDAVAAAAGVIPGLLGKISELFRAREAADPEVTALIRAVTQTRGSSAPRLISNGVDITPVKKAPYLPEFAPADYYDPYSNIPLEEIEKAKKLIGK